MHVRGRFNDGDKFAVMKKGKKRALKVCDSEFEAEVWMQANGGDYIERGQERIRNVLTIAR